MPPLLRQAPCGPKERQRRDRGVCIADSRERPPRSSSPRGGLGVRAARRRLGFPPSGATPERDSSRHVPPSIPCPRTARRPRALRPPRSSIACRSTAVKHIHSLFSRGAPPLPGAPRPAPPPSRPPQRRKQAPDDERGPSACQPIAAQSRLLRTAGLTGASLNSATWRAGAGSAGRGSAGRGSAGRCSAGRGAAARPIPAVSTVTPVVPIGYGVLPLASTSDGEKGPPHGEKGPGGIADLRLPIAD